MSQVIVGLCAHTHDSAAALMLNGRLAGFCEEERLNGIKHSNAFPQRSVDWLLEQAGLTRFDVTTVAYNFVPHRYLTALAQLPGQTLRLSTSRRAIPRARSFVKVAARTRRRLRDLADRFPNARIRPTVHHLAHAWIAFQSSGFQHAGVLVADSLGEIQTTTTWRAGTGEKPLTQLSCLDDPASLGYAYGAITEHLGWRRGDEEGTVMALAAHGDPARFKDLMCQAIRAEGHGFTLDPTLLPLRILSGRYGRVSDAFVAATCPPRHPDEPVEQVHADLAAAVQARTEQVMLALAAYIRRATGSRLLCVGGGVAMNCVAIGKIAAAGFFDEVHVPAAPGDSGTAIGAAADAWHAATGKLPVGIEGRCYLGPDFKGLNLPAQPRPGLRAAHIGPTSAGILARHLADGKIIGVFDGALEAGPRALGHRSILASPLEVGVVDRLNATVKFREPFRPFAPVVLADRAADYFLLDQPSPFMSVAVGATDHARKHLPAIVHDNGTARVQTVTASQNPLLAKTLSVFGEITGHPVLINTSLNVKGKPICGTPDMALDCLAESGLDALLIEGWWVVK